MDIHQQSVSGRVGPRTSSCARRGRISAAEACRGTNGVEIDVAALEMAGLGRVECRACVKHAGVVEQGDFAGLQMDRARELGLLDEVNERAVGAVPIPADPR